MGKKAIIALIAGIFALSLALVGCSGNSGGSGEDPTAAAKKAFTGTWDMVEMSQGDDITGSDDIETLKALGLEVYLNLNEDNTAEFVMFGEAIEGTWEASSPTSGHLDLGTAVGDMTLADERLTFEQDGSSITFARSDAETTGSSSGGSGSSASGSAESSSS